MTQVPTGKTRHVLFEPLGLVLLSLATVGTAWCSFQAASWQGASQKMMNLSAASAREAAGDELKSSQLALLDVLLFSEYINARANSNQTTARFYADRFRAEAKEAFTAWMATNPFENTNAPPHPFVPSLYKPKLLAVAEEAQSKSQRLWEQAGNAGRTGRNYVLVTVLLASALFCGGTAPKFETRWVRKAVLAVGLCAFGFAAVHMVTLPVLRL
jgi:hypothetical protein